MELLVCVKQVPDDSVAVTLDANGAPKVAEITPVVNAFDTYALEMAARFKEANGGSVTVLSLRHRAFRLRRHRLSAGAGCRQGWRAAL